MPRESILNPYPDDQPFRLSVGWNRDTDVQVGIQVNDETSTLLDHLYGGHLDQLENAGRALLAWLFSPEAELLRQHPDFRSSGEERSTCQQLGSQVMEWVEGGRTYVPERDGIWVSMSRPAINDTIRHLRKARDTAYGRDE